MKPKVTRLTTPRAKNEHRPKALTLAEDAELAAFRRSISKLNVRQLRDLHARLSARLKKTTTRTK